jgi:hypothetical protein
VSRGLWQRLAYRKIYLCPCGNSRTVEPRPLYSAVARCPKCSGTQLRRRSKRDGIDPLLRNPFRMAQMLLGGTLYHCEYCRIQFYDLRSRLRDPEPPKELSETSGAARGRR